MFSPYTIYHLYYLINYEITALFQWSKEVRNYNFHELILDEYQYYITPIYNNNIFIILRIF